MVNLLQKEKGLQILFKIPIILWFDRDHKQI